MLVRAAHREGPFRPVCHPHILNFRSGTSSDLSLSVWPLLNSPAISDVNAMSVEEKARNEPTLHSLGAVPRTVVALGFVSLFMDMSSEIIHSLLPVFLATVIGASALYIGIIEGIAEAATPVTKLFSGAISDWMGKRKPLILLGYGLAALTKPLFPLASGAGMVLVARFVDRVAKGLRGAPRDALVGDWTPKELRATAFGLRQAMDTVGAFVGPLLAMLLMVASQSDFRLVFWVAVIPAGFTVLIILFGVKDADGLRSQERRAFPIRRSELARLDFAFWGLVGIATVLTLGRFIEAFLLLLAEHLGLAVALVPGVLVLMNMVYAASAYPFGRLADRLDRRMLLALGVVFLIVADLVLATATSIWQTAVGVILWGLHMGATQGLLTTLVVDAAPARLRGTALGIYNVITGGALLAASVFAGWLWTTYGPGATFFAGALFGGIALFGIWSWQHR
jgi:MFS family permease